MDLNVNKEFFGITTFIIVIVVIVIIVSILYEFAFPMNLNNRQTAGTSIILVFFIGIIFLFIPNNKKDKSKTDFLDKKFIAYLLLLIILTLINLF
jgi:hypothetical protein